MGSEIAYMIFAFIVGMLLGTIFFGGLWFTVKKAMASKIPALWVFSSFLLRVSITLIGFYFIGVGDWKRLIICLAGFIIARFVVIYYTKLIDQKEFKLKKEANHET